MLWLSIALAQILMTIPKVTHDCDISTGHQMCSLSGAVLRLASIQREVVVAGRGYSELKG